MAVIDVAGFVADLKDHAVEHRFHVHDERHFVETYSLRQFWEVDLHPEEGCGGPIDLHLALEVDPRTLLDFEDSVIALPDDIEPPRHWAVEPVDHRLDERRTPRRAAADQGRMSFSVAVNRSPDSSSSPSMCRRAGPVSVHRSRK